MIDAPVDVTLLFGLDRALEPRASVRLHHLHRSERREWLPNASPRNGSKPVCLCRKVVNGCPNASPRIGGKPEQLGHMATLALSEVPRRESGLRATKISYEPDTSSE